MAKLFAMVAGFALGMTGLIVWINYKADEPECTWGGIAMFVGFLVCGGAYVLLKQENEQAYADLADGLAKDAWEAGKQTFTFRTTLLLTDQVVEAVTRRGWKFKDSIRGTKNEGVVFMRTVPDDDNVTLFFTRGA